MTTHFTSAQWIPEEGVVKSTYVNNIITLTQSEYDALLEVDLETLYIIVEEES